MYLGIDCGTQGTKALLIDSSGAPLGRGYAPHQLIERPNGAREQHPSWWVEAMTTAVTTALASSPNTPVEALAVSGQQHGLVVLDEALEVIRPAKLWNDTETAPENEELIRRFGDPRAFFDRFGILPFTGYTVSKLLWLQQREPENFARIRHILLPHDYLNFWLTGRLAAEYGDSSGTGFFDPRTRQWCPEILASIDGGTGQLAAALPPLLGPDEILGTLRPQAAAALGLPPTCLVATGGGDNMMGAIGTGNVRPGIVTLSLGTSSTVYSFQSSPPNDPTGNVAPFCSSNGGWLPLVCTMNCTNVVTQTLATLGKTVADIEPALASTAAGADGLIAAAFLNGERTPDLPTARGTLTGISTTNFTPPHLMRAVIEGVSFGILNGLDLIQHGQPVQRIIAIGGGSKSLAWRQLLADAAGATVDVPTEEEAGSLGAAIQALHAHSHAQGNPETFETLTARCVELDPSRTTHPNPATREEYEAARHAYNHAVRTLYAPSR